MKNIPRLVQSRWEEDRPYRVEKKTTVRLCSLHDHDFYELDIVLEGQSPTVLNGETWVAERGTVFFLTPEDLHDYPDDRPLVLYNIQFPESAVSSPVLHPLTQNGQRRFRLESEDFTLLCSFAASMEQTEDPAIGTRLLECILLLLTRALPQETASSHQGGGLQKAVLYLHAHFRENPSLGQVADLLPLNQRYFCKKFRAYTGKTYKEYLRMLKLRYARRMVLATDRSMLDIAQESGYATQSHFNREFREYYSQTPLELRKQKGK